MKRLAIQLALLLASTALARAEAVLPAFDPAGFPPGQTIDNRYFPLAEGFYRDLTPTLTTAGVAGADERILLQYGGRARFWAACRPPSCWIRLLKTGCWSKKPAISMRRIATATSDTWARM